MILTVGPLTHTRFKRTILPLFTQLRLKRTLRSRSLSLGTLRYLLRR